MSNDVELYGGCSAPQDFIDSVRLQIEDGLPALHPGARYTAKTLCGGGFWKLLTRGERILAGRCVAHMVVHKQLPLKFSEPGGNCSKRYELI